MPFQELPTGLIFAGINVPDHDLLFQQIAQTISSSTPPSSGTLGAEDMGLDNSDTKASAGSKSHVVILQSKDCANLKSAQKSMIEQFLGLGIAGAINPLEVPRFPVWTPFNANIVLKEPVVTAIRFLTTFHLTLLSTRVG
jgi:origin recognition complex subunit 3